MIKFCDTCDFVSVHPADMPCRECVNYDKHQVTRTVTVDEYKQELIKQIHEISTITIADTQCKYFSNTKLLRLSDVLEIIGVKE